MGKGKKGLGGQVKEVFTDLKDEACGLVSDGIKAGKAVRNDANDLIAEGKQAFGYKSIEEQYRDNVNANYKRVCEILDNADKNFMAACRTGNAKQGFEAFMKAVSACVMAMKVAVVDAAEKLGINDMLRKNGIVENSPINIMKNFERQLKDIEPSLKESVAEAIKEMKKDANKHMEKASKKVQEFFRG